MILSLLSKVKLQTTFLKYFSSNVFGSFVTIFSGFFTYRYIDPDLMGIWALFTVLELYATFTRLGIINGLGRELPYFLGRNENDLAKGYASTALLYSLSSNIILFLVILFLFYFDFFSLSNQYYLVTFIVVLLRLLFTSYTSYLSVTFRTTKSFNDLSNVKIALAFIDFATVFLIVLYGFWGLLMRHLLLSLFEMIFLHFKRPISVSPSFNKSHFIDLFKVGFPLFMVSYISGFVETIPSLFLINFGTIEELGLFSPFLVMINTAILLPNAISSYMYPKMSFEFGKSNNKLKLWRIVKITALVSFFSGILMFISIYFLADYLHYIFPKYIKIFPYLKWGSILLIFIGYKSANITFAVLKSWNYMFLNLGIFVFISVISIFLLNKYFDDILSIAILSMIITYLLMFIISVYLSFKVTHKIN